MRGTPHAWTMTLFGPRDFAATNAASGFAKTVEPRVRRLYSSDAAGGFPCSDGVPLREGPQMRRSATEGPAASTRSSAAETS
jgi:hypothetical protein